MRIARSITLALAAMAAAACSREATVETPTIPPLAYVRYINAVPDTLNTTVRWIDELEFTPQTFINVPFRSQGQGGYQGLKAGSRKFRVFTADVSTFSTAGNTQILVDTTITFDAGKYYTLLHVGYARPGFSPRQRIQLIEDVRPTPTGGNIALRAIHSGLDLGSADIHATATTTTSLVGSTPAFAGVSYGTVSSYGTRASGAFALQLAAPGSTTSLAATLAPAGIVGTVTADPIGGATVGGSVITAIAFPASAANSAGTRFAAPGFGFFIDRQPPRTTSP